jgi:c(7)-type cytochrome triheme protein
MIKRPFLATSLISLTTFFLFTGPLSAEYVHDPKTDGPKNPITWNKPIKATFEHKTHTVDAGIECSSCHDDIFFMQRGVAVKSKRFTMKSMADGEFCGTCHDGDTAFATNTNCMACHSVSEEPLMWHEPTKASFSHTAHVEEFELECDSCHNGTFAMKKGAAIANKDFTMAAFKDGKYCGSCHNGDDAFDSSTQCESCHYPPTEKIVFTQPVMSVVFDHKIHVTKAELSCESCHKEVFTMKRGTVEGEKLVFSDDPMEKRKYLEALHNKFCGTCHDSAQAFGYLTRCTVCHIGVKGQAQINGQGAAKDKHSKSGH